MKKTIIIIAALLLIPMFAAAQRGIPRSNTVSVSSTVITKTTKAPNIYEARVGFQQMAGVNIGAYAFEDLGLGGSYIGGYRFNDRLFAGVGVEFNHVVGMDDYDIPLYAHLRTYFTKRIWRPYISLSAGGAYCYESGNYSNLWFYGDFSCGVDAHLFEKLNVYMGIGVNLKGVLFKTGLSF